MGDVIFKIMINILFPHNPEQSGNALNPAAWQAYLDCMTANPHLTPDFRYEHEFYAALSTQPDVSIVDPDGNLIVRFKY